MEERTIKRGDTLSLDCTRRNAAGDPVVISGSTIRAKVRRGTFVAELTVTPTNPAGGEFTLSALPTMTQNFPVGPLFCDVEFMSGTGTVASSGTFKIIVEEDVTF